MFLFDISGVRKSLLGMDRVGPSVEPLLGEEGANREWWSLLVLPTVMCTSATGMLLFKFSQNHDSAVALTAGYLLEGFAFAIYPYSLRHHTLRFVTTSWASSSIFMSYTGGYLIYGETPSTASIIGGILIIAGVVMTLF